MFYKVDMRDRDESGIPIIRDETGKQVIKRSDGVPVLLVHEVNQTIPDWFASKVGAATLLIVHRCRQEGREDAVKGLPVSANPYSIADRELEHVSWKDGWTKAAVK